MNPNSIRQSNIDLQTQMQAKQSVLTLFINAKLISRYKTVNIEIEQKKLDF